MLRGRCREEAAMDPRAQAMQRLQARRRFQRHALIYVVVIGLFVLIWALTDFGGYFWPIWPALVWGIVLAIHAWTVFGQRPITEADVEQEMRRDRKPDQPAGG
jgi:fatty acid desaturase